MARRPERRNGEWETPKNGFEWQHVQVEVLMDIREELRMIRALAECGNVQAGFIAMQRMDKHMRKRFPVKPRTKKS